MRRQYYRTGRCATGVVVALALCGRGLGAQAALAAPGLSDVARAFVRLEEALEQHPPSPEDRPRFETAFDAATRRFFFADLRGALRALDAMYAELAVQGSDPGEALALAALRIDVEPALVPWRAAHGVALRLRSLYEPDLVTERERSARVVLRGPRGERLAEAEVALPELAPVDRSLELSFPAPLEGPATFAIELIDDAGVVHGRTRFCALAEEPSERDARFQAAAEALSADRPELARALASFRARCELLRSLADPERAALAPLDPPGLERELASELETLRAGRDPYHARTGDLWRVLDVDGVRVPVRLFVPARGAADPPALVVALHGAGGNEHLFFEGYGRGRLRRLAEERGFVLVAPSTYPFVRAPQRLELLLDELARDVAFDPRRVFVIGHSLGAMTAAQLARRGSGRFAKLCCVAGGGDFGREPAIPPVLVVLGALDSIVPAAAVERDVERARANGLPVELRVLAGRGHTLMVPAAIDLALDWTGLPAPRVASDR